MNCLSCGKATPDHGVFCMHCGQRVAAPSLPNTVSPLVHPPAQKAHRLTREEVGYWRDEFSGFDNWGTGKPFGDRSLRLLSSLNPPFTPEHEPLIFDPGINSGVFRVSEVSFGNVILRDGFFFGTDSRLIFGNQDMGVGGQKGLVLQVPYVEVGAAYTSNDSYTLALRDGAQCLIRTKVPRPSLLGAMAILGGSPVDKANISRMEREKAEGAQIFVSTMIAFFSRLADNALSQSNSEPPAPAGRQISVMGTQSPASTATADFDRPVVIQKPWYYSTGCLLMAFLFAGPLWSLLILTNKDSRGWVKVVAGIVLAFYLLAALAMFAQS